MSASKTTPKTTFASTPSTSAHGTPPVPPPVKVVPRPAANDTLRAPGRAVRMRRDAEHVLDYFVQAKAALVVRRRQLEDMVARGVFAEDDLTAKTMLGAIYAESYALIEAEMLAHRLREGVVDDA